MNIYKVTPNQSWYGQFEGIIVVAENEERALEIGYSKDHSWDRVKSENNNYSCKYIFERKQYPLKAEIIDLNKEDVPFVSYLYE
ncbi:hypothetical protein [Aerococcus viridans]|uniref:hypothetical protein n=1 Tax=Aerococcus viridans TaxID=1377 RepID=UPI00223C2DC9|nr:hypothetical protein [Aerococcus viridans]MCT1798484.1 hypothetical protein [Aerococcus viridans]